MKKNITCLLLVTIIISIFCLSLIVSSSQTINVKDYIKDKFLSAFILYLSSLEDLDSYEKEFIDLLENLPEEEQEYYSKEVYKNGFSLELLKNVKEGKAIQVPASDPALPSLSNAKEKPIESLPSLIKRIKPSVVIVFAYDDKGEFLQLGSGFFISQNGDIITNYHLLYGASSAEIKTSDRKTYPITYIIAGDEQNDIIRLSVDIPSEYVLPLSLSETIPEIGERIIVYDNPLELEYTVSDGFVFSVKEIFNYDKIIQITAPISPGSNGSPVLNMNGEVIGIATFQMIEGRNLNFAIPSERIASLNLAGEKKTSVGEELFEQEEKDKKDFDYAYEAYNKALYFTDKREYEEALPYLEIAIKTNISSLKARAYLQIGFCYGMLGAHTKEIEVYIQAICINPDDAIGHYNLGIAYYKLGFHKDAIEAFKQAIRIDPDYAKTYCNLGVTYGQLSFNKEEIEAYMQAIRIDPDYAMAHYNLGAAYGQLSFHEGAIEAFKQAIRIDPNYAAAHYNLSVAYLQIGDRNSALNEYRILKRLDIDLADKLFEFIY
jgi:tetratricopeptide (TPR) repeat protein